MNMILLHRSGNDREIYLNTDFIESIQVDGGKTAIAMVAYDSGVYTVRETPDEILQMIRGGE